LLTRVSRLLAVTAIGATFVVAGCGGDDETTSTSSTTTAGASGATGATGVALTAREFVDQANEICLKGNKETDAAAEQVFTGGQPTEAQLDQFASLALPSIEAQINAISALTPPEEIASDVTTFLDDARAAVDKVKADPSLLAATSGADDPFNDVTVQAKALGLDECSN
jgi:hypothetical protein